MDIRQPLAAAAVMRSQRKKRDVQIPDAWQTILRQFLYFSSVRIEMVFPDSRE